ncbi:hypothetical protein F0562_007092 [Nyssa sinensis]|uniref:Protein cereblon n=1 Tax=Nyssa sinensis TaxID=561372 RepID=A0A5J5A7A5_9ASTE|nr:hypothetical protein F0562_007092 [Nyssa sinensis]
MEEERILESERYQMEQIRELEFEELQVEEVQGLDDSSDDNEANDRGYGGVSASGEFSFNISLASLHTYLGEVEDTHHRLTFLDGGAVLNLPLFYQEGVVLFPEATLPLRVIQPNFIASVERALRQVDAPYTIGVVHVYKDPDNGRIRFSTIGTTAEIRQYRRLEDGSLNVLTRGQQRFRLRRCWIDVEGIPCGEIQIIQEDLPLRTPRDAVGQLAPLRNLGAGGLSQTPSFNSSQAKQFGYDEDDSDAISEESFESELSLTERRLHQSAIVTCYGSSHRGGERSENAALRTSEKFISGRQSCKAGGQKRDSVSRMHEVPRAFWPFWVYRMYDSYCLAQRVADMWKQIVGAPSMDGFVNKPDLLSFYIGSKIPVSESTRQELLEIDGISYRLRREIELLESFDRVRCKNCQTVIGRRSDMLVMSSEGPLGAYVNPGGYVHEIMTLLKANGLALIGSAIKEYSWFPGYAWTIAECATCERQMGWLFTASNKKLKPKLFWGIRSSQVANDMH